MATANTGASRWSGLSPAEQRLLDQALYPGETWLRSLRGRQLEAPRPRRGVLVATDRRLVFLTRNWWGASVDEIPYDKIHSLRWEVGALGYGRLTLAASGYALRLGAVPNHRLAPFVGWLRGRLWGQRG